MAVVYGGRSGEHEVSLVSAESVIAAMNPERYEVVRYLIAKDGRWSPGPILPEPGANPGIDVVFPGAARNLRRRRHRAGPVRTRRSALCRGECAGFRGSMDKDVMKRVCRDRGLPMVEYMVLEPRRDRSRTRSRASCRFRCL